MQPHCYSQLQCPSSPYRMHLSSVAWMGGRTLGSDCINEGRTRGVSSAPAKVEQGTVAACEAHMASRREQRVM